MAIAGINHTLMAKGVVTTAEIDRSLAFSEQTPLGDHRIIEDLSPANRDVIAFPIHLLKLANSRSNDAGTPSFQDQAVTFVAVRCTVLLPKF